MKRLFVGGFQCKSRAVRVCTGNACPFPKQVHSTSPKESRKICRTGWQGERDAEPAAPWEEGDIFGGLHWGVCCSGKAPWWECASPASLKAREEQARSFFPNNLYGSCLDVCRLLGCWKLKPYTIKSLEYILII